MNISFENQRHYAYLYFDGNTPETCREDILSGDFGRFMNACNMLNHWPYGIPHDDDCPKGITGRHIGELKKLAENAAREAFGPRLFQLWMTVLKNTRVNTEWTDTSLTACFSHGEPPYFQQSMIATVAWLAVRLDKPVTDLNDILQIAHMTEQMATIAHNSCKDLCPMDRIRLWQRIMELMFHRNYAETVCIIRANYPGVYPETEKGAV